MLAWRNVIFIPHGFHKTSCQLGVYTQPTYVQDDARRVSREHRDVVTSSVYTYECILERSDLRDEQAQ